MPAINIMEVDQSRYTTPAVTPRVVALVPGLSTFGPVFSADNPKVGIFQGKSDIKRFAKEYGSYVNTDVGRNNYEYVMNLLYSNVTVLFGRICPFGTATTAGANLKCTDDVTLAISAKYVGTLGSELIVAIKRADAANKQDYIVYVSNAKTVTADENGNYAEASVTAKANVLENFRISSNPNSVYYVDKVNSEYIVLPTIEDLNKLADIADVDTEFYCVKLSGGQDDIISGDGNEEASVREYLKNYKNFYAHFADPYIYDFDFITSGGIGETAAEFNNETLHYTMLQLANSRGDCVPFFDLGVSTSSSAVTDYARTITTKFGLDPSYAALYAPYGKINSLYSNTEIAVPPSLIVLMTIGYNLDRNSDQELWYAPAGITRARANFVTSTTPYEVGAAVLNDFQNNNTYRVNPIMKLKNYGYTVFGQATCLQGEVGVPASALESLNVRLVCNVVKKAIFATCTSLTFEYNNNNLWSSFYTQMDEVLRYILNHNGISDYRITMDEETNTIESINARTVKGRVVIVPVLCGEKFDVDFIITPAGVTLTESSESEAE